MIQKTYQITDFSNGSVQNMLCEVAALPEYRSAAQVLLVAFEHNWDTEEIERQMRLIREALPKAEIVGSTHFDDDDSAGSARKDEKSSAVFSFLFFEQPAFTLRSCFIGELSDAEAGQMINRVIRETGGCKGVILLLSEAGRNADVILASAGEGVEHVPIFGATAALFINTWGDATGYVFDEDGVYQNAAVLILFNGEDVRVKATYNYGWTPIGKKMTITGMEGDFYVTEIDGRPAMEVYRRYLGLSPALIIVPNVCEFPLIVERNGLVLGRVPVTCERGGRLRFAAALREGEQIRFSYGAQKEIFTQVYQDAESYLPFAPQGMFLTICGNRLTFLKNDEHYEVDYYRQLVPQLAVMHGNSEIYQYGGAGGELNSALVTIGIREGEPEKQEVSLARRSFLGDSASTNFVIPLEYRVMFFLSAVTEDLVRMTDEANAANRAKSAYLSVMSHEIRTPINAVLGMDEMILRESQEDETLEYAENIHSAGTSLLGLINDILDVSKIEAGKMDIIPVEYRTASMFGDLVVMIRPRAEEKGLKLSVEADAALPAGLFGDEVRIKQIVTNILTNAVKYTEEGNVTLRVHAEPSEREGYMMLCVSVADTGIGIKEEDKAKLFSAFERIEEKRNRNIEGTGLGMNITQNLLAMMDSHLEVESVYGKGSTFSFRLEQKIVDAAPMGELSEAFRRGATERRHYRELFHAPGAKVLVVDDTPMNLTVIRGLLKKTRVRVITAESGAEALELAAREPFDVFLIDHLMPDMDGVETLRRLKVLPGLANKPFIVLTANDAPGAQEMYLEAGFSDYLAKPVDGKALETLLMNYLPPEKVEKTDAAEAVPDTAALPEWLYHVDGLDTAAGLRHCGTAETYLDTLTIFAKNAASGADEIASFRQTNDVDNITVKVHALKSMARVIGAKALGALAEKLELAGKDGDTRTLYDELDELLERFRALGGSLARLLLTDVTEDEPLPLISADQLREVYDSIREFAANLDSDSIQFVLGRLKGYRIPEGDRERVEAIVRAAAEFEWDRVNELSSEEGGF